MLCIEMNPKDSTTFKCLSLCYFEYAVLYFTLYVRKSSGKITDPEKMDQHD